MSDSTDPGEDRLADIISKFGSADQSLQDLIERAESLEQAASSYRDAEQAMAANTGEAVAALDRTEERFSQHAAMAEALAAETQETASTLRGVVEQLDVVLAQLARINPDRIHEDLSTLNTQVVTMDSRVSRLEVLGDKITESIATLQGELVKRIRVAQVVGALAVIAAALAAFRAW